MSQSIRPTLCAWTVYITCEKPRCSEPEPGEDVGCLGASQMARGAYGWPTETSIEV